MTQFTGHRILDNVYIQEYLAPILRSIIPDGHFKVRTAGNGMHLTVYSRQLHFLWTERFKMPAGKKSYTVVIPDEVLQAGSNIVRACVRGIFDTDGCVAFDKRPTYKKPYIRIIFAVLHNSLVESRALATTLHIF